MVLTVWDIWRAGSDTVFMLGHPVLSQYFSNLRGVRITPHFSLASR